ncbi:rhomboid family intramembrane serine protease [Pedobacter frigoris]|uniref:rhomboid family intramembrane serine protease n=1 Tax=Pedobacter frigoris TaxID=2571272 RepID=UPI00292CEF90|nr:rhomboid family intramembrane serine protease [Pedobacter frigoris]
MNNSPLKELKHKVFQSGDPSYLYIGINVIIFVVFALINIPFFLSGNGSIAGGDWIREYFGFPASLVKLPTRFYTILTYQFFHGGFFHLLFNMLWLFWMGRIFLDFLKPRQFHFVYLAGGFTGALLYLLAYNIFPVFASSAGATVIGSSASVMAIVVATATLVPDYSIRLLFLGDLKLKFLAIAYVVLNLIGIGTADAGGSFAHIGGMIMGFTFIKLLQNGNDLSNIFKKKPKLRVVKKDPAKPSFVKKKETTVDQKEIDAILDKISKTGYDKLTREEKETLFKASKH